MTKSPAMMCVPPLSSVDINGEQIGYEAARLVDRMIHGAKPPSKPILIAPRRVVIRQSSDSIAIDDPDIAAAMRFIRDHAGEPITHQGCPSGSAYLPQDAGEAFLRYPPTDPQGGNHARSSATRQEHVGRCAHSSSGRRR